MLATKPSEFHSLNFDKENNSGKENFYSIYRHPDPREYFRVLSGLDYMIPDLAKPVFRSLIAHVRNHIGRPPRVLDIGCSYGINAALSRFPLDMQRLAQRYSAPEMQGLDGRVLGEFDSSYFHAWPLLSDATFIGLDASEPAIDYAVRAGIMDAGIAADFECADPSVHEVRTLRDVDLIVSTGCAGHVTGRTFAKILDLQKDSRMPWVANFALRTHSFAPVARALESHGIITEKLDGVTFIERQFHCREEMASAVEALGARGIDPAGKESEGFLHAELFVSRPQGSIQAMPLRDLVTITSAANHTTRKRVPLLCARPH